LILNLGVNEIPYAWAPPTPKRQAVRRKKGGTTTRHEFSSSAAMTTYDVAMILEDHYHIMELFWTLNEAQIMTWIENSLEGYLETAMTTGTVGDVRVAFATFVDQIEDLFKSWLDTDPLAGIVPGVTTMAAKMGIRTGTDRKKRHGPPRPSFIDTGLYRGNFRAEVV
jgi:hypothetical protein